MRPKVRKPERSKFEQLKADSGYLREPLATELENDLPYFTDDAVQILKFHGSYQQDNRDNRRKGESKDWGMMLRLRSPEDESRPSSIWRSMISPINTATAASEPRRAKPSNCTASRKRISAPWWARLSATWAQPWRHAVISTAM